MANPLVPVSPGDIITADFMNQLIAAMNDLATRVADLEVLDTGGGDVLGNGKPVIISVAPIDASLSPDSVVMGKQMKVVGRSLDPARLVSITLGSGDVRLHNVTGNDRQLFFTTPAVLGIPSGGGRAKLTIENDKGSDEVDLFVLPAVPTDLRASFGMTVTPPPDELEPNTSYDFTYSLVSITTLAARYTLTPVITGGWRAVIKGGANQIDIPRSAPTPDERTVIVTVTTGAAGTGPAALTLQIAANQFPDQKGESDPTALALDAATVINTEVSFLRPPNRVGASYDQATDTVTVRAGDAGTLGIRVQLATPTVTYDIVSVTVDTQEGKWRPVLQTTSPFPGGAAANAVKIVNVELTPADDAPPAKLKVTIKRRGSTEPDAVFEQKIARA